MKNLVFSTLAAGLLAVSAGASAQQVDPLQVRSWAISSIENPSSRARRMKRRVCTSASPYWR